MAHELLGAALALSAWTVSGSWRFGPKTRRRRGRGSKPEPAGAHLSHAAPSLPGGPQACYSLQPSKTLARPVAAALSRGQRGAQLGRLYGQAMASAARTVQRASWLRAAAPGLDPARLTVSLAESLCFRAVAKPATFTLKLWGSW